MLLIGAGLVGGYFLLTKTEILGPKGPTAEDMAMMQMLAETQQAARVQQQEMMAIIGEMRSGAGGAAAAADPWSSPETWTKFAEIGVDFAGLFT